MSALFWVYLGVALVFAEILTPTFFIVFFGMSALTVALLTWLAAVSFTWQWVLFSALSVVYLVSMRRGLKRVFVGGGRKSAEDIDDDFVGKHATVEEAILPNQAGRVEFRGCRWEAEADEAIPAGARVRIRAKDNITLVVERA